MIPKIIHYCWLSDDPYPELISKCINSWRKHLPDYEIVLWDRNRIDINSNLWLQQAYENRKYAFAADYIRFYALYHYGGIYLDADVEVLKSFDDLLSKKQFVGEEAGGDIEAAVIGVEKGLSWVKKCLEYYSERTFVKLDGKFDMRPVPLMVSEVLFGMDIEVKPFHFFSPKDIKIGKIFVNNETYCIHHFDGKWVEKDLKFKFKMSVHCVLYWLLGRMGRNKIVHFIRKIKK